MLQHVVFTGSPAIAAAWWPAHIAALQRQWAPALQHLAAALLHQRRWLATARGHAREAGVKPHLLQALRFTVSQQEADAAYVAYHSSLRNPLLARAPSWEKVGATPRAKRRPLAATTGPPVTQTLWWCACGAQCTPTFLPFWLHDVTVEARASRAQVGRRVPVQRRVNNRTETHFETQWSWASLPYSRTARYDPEDPEMQVGAAAPIYGTSVAAGMIVVVAVATRRLWQLAHPEASQCRRPSPACTPGPRCAPPAGIWRATRPSCGPGRWWPRRARRPSRRPAC